MTQSDFDGGQSNIEKYNSLGNNEVGYEGSVDGGAKAMSREGYMN